MQVWGAGAARACPALFQSATLDKTKADILQVLGKQEAASEGPVASLRGKGHDLL